jgi:NADP-dependent 3-hydroxy acid dehydrogenase YdfG
MSLQASELASVGVSCCRSDPIHKLKLRLKSRPNIPVIAARRLEPLQKTQKEIQDLGGKCDIAHPLNIREEESCNSVIKSIVEKHKRLDGLVNNAG